MPRRPRRRTPLAYMLENMNDPTVSVERRDALAIAAAPYVHSKVGRAGKKARQAEEAQKVGGAGSVWGNDLRVDGQRRQ
jgi:phage terminase small subunit